MKQVRFQGLTPLAASMQHNVLEPVVFNLAQSGQLQKPVLVITITDGEPSDNPRDAILQVIANARRRLAPQYGPKCLAFQFAQVTTSDVKNCRTLVTRKLVDEFSGSISSIFLR